MPCNMKQPSLNWVLWLIFGTCIKESSSNGALYLYPLADNTGTAEMINGGTDGSVGLGDVTKLDKKYPFEYDTLYFHGTSSSFAELNIGEHEDIESDWSFTMFVYAAYPYKGTVFDCLFENSSDNIRKSAYNSMRLNLNGSEAVLTLLGKEDNKTVIFENVFAKDQWVSFMFFDYDSVETIELFTIDEEFQTADEYIYGIKLPRPAKFKLGEGYITSDPFEGSIACFAIYNFEMFADLYTYRTNTIQECQSNIPKRNLIGFGLQAFKKAYSCTLPPTQQDIDTECILFDISCGKNKRIAIKNALFGFRDSPSISCETGKNECRNEDDYGCCTITDRDEIEKMKKNNMHDIYFNCSFQSKCRLQADTDTKDGNYSTFAVIYYVCQPVGFEIHFCDTDSQRVTGNAVSIIFDGNTEKDDYSAQCYCNLTTNPSTRGYRISAPDLRLQPVSESCTTTLTIAGLVEKNISCSTALTKMDPVDQFSDSQIQLSFKSKPEFIWMLAQAKGFLPYTIIKTAAKQMTGENLKQEFVW